MSDIFDELDALLENIEEKEVKKRPQLNDQQFAIVDAPIDSAFRVLAGPGSGKTRVLEERITRLIAEGAQPGEILYVVFNRSMADEGSERIANRLYENDVPHAEVAQFQRWFCTIHAACFRIVNQWWVDQGKRAPQVAKTWIIKKHLTEIAKMYWQWEGTPDDPEGRPSAGELYTAINNAKHHNLSIGHDGSFYQELFGDFHAQRLVEARERFDKTLRAENLVTFPDMLFGAEQLLQKDPAFRQKWQDQFKWVMVDEAQDTNEQAMRVLHTLSLPQGNFVVVGDTDQMMYRFAGAAPEKNLYNGFTDRFPKGMTFPMETNYRSTPAIIEACNKMIQYNYESGNGPYPEIFRKSLSARDGMENGSKVSFQMYTLPEEEAMSVATDIQSQISNGRVPGDFFIGTRTKAQLGYIEPILTRMQIPFINITGGSFWHMRHIKQCVDYLRLAANHADSEALKTVYNVSSNQMRNREGEYTATRYLGRQFLSWCNGAISTIEHNQYSGYYESNGTPGWRNWSLGIDDLMGTVSEIENVIAIKGISSAAQWIIDYVLTRNLREELDDEDRLQFKLDDLQTVVDVASDFTEIDELMAYIDEAIKAAEDAKEKNWDKYVVLSTIHRLKGLERAVVYSPGWCEGYRETKTDVIPVGLLPHTFSLTEPPKIGPLDISSMNSIEDERCIAFVAISRAKEEVHLSGVTTYRKAKMTPSRFINEIFS